MSAADGFNVLRITDKHGAPVMRSWRVTVQLPPAMPLDDSAPAAKVAGLLGVALVRAEHATRAAQIVRETYPGADVFDVEPYR